MDCDTIHEAVKDLPRSYNVGFIRRCHKIQAFHEEMIYRLENLFVGLKTLKMVRSFIGSLSEQKEEVYTSELTYEDILNRYMAEKMGVPEQFKRLHIYLADNEYSIYYMHRPSDRMSDQIYGLLVDALGRISWKDTLSEEAYTRLTQWLDKFNNKSWKVQQIKRSYDKDSPVNALIVAGKITSSDIRVRKYINANYADFFSDMGEILIDLKKHFGITEKDEKGLWKPSIDFRTFIGAIA